MLVSLEAKLFTISQTFKTGNSLIDAAQGSVRVGLGYIVILLVVQTLLAFCFKSLSPILDIETIQMICRCVVFYFLAAYSCQKVF
ncbi:MAG: hypothetical protein LBT79_07900 [Elusimicrobiota bacterium]|nr:hypothetical protein [Elusimicrobiota bacterium]